jgi:mannose-6-phosphate isomerase
MWYVMQADDDANLIVGFNQKVNSESYLNHLENKSLTEILNFEQVKEGDAFFIEVGRIHAIGAGVMVAEIQQTSDITYRIYDWDRVDKNGKERELHNELAIDAINFDMEDNFKVSYKDSKNLSNNMVTCPYFTTNFLPINGKLNRSNTYDSFLIYLCVDGKATIVYDQEETEIGKGETVLIPAKIKEFEIHSDYAKLLEVYV